MLDLLGMRGKVCSASTELEQIFEVDGRAGRKDTKRMQAKILEGTWGMQRWV